MKKLLFLITLMFASFQMNAEDYSNVNYIQQYGDLQLKGLQLSDSQGNAVQLKGWSTFGLQWQVSCYNQTAFQTMKDWGANIVRLAMYVYEEGASTDMDGYITKVKGFIDATYNVGIYCLVDWHVLNPGTPSSYLNNALNGKGAEYFFDAISAYVKQKGYVHVLYEICNEPNNCSWSDIKSYASTVLPHISTNDPGAIVIVGTPQWDQLIDQASSSPISYSSLNLMYAFHYYACSHQQFLSKLTAASANIPVFVSEWGPVNFDGDMSKGSDGEYIICDTESDLLLAACDGKNDGGVKISWCSWNWGDKDEGSSALKNCGNLSESGLQSSGAYVKSKLCQTCTTKVVTAGPYGGAAQAIPNELFEIAYYDLGGEGIGYHDGDGTDYECAGKGLTENNEGKTINVNCSSYTNGCNCNAGYMYAGEDFSFRNGECVDVSSCMGVAGTAVIKSGSSSVPYASYNLGNRENDEWLIYTVDVKEAGYYTFQYQANPSTSGTVSFTVERDGDSFGNAVYNYETEEPYTGTLTFDSSNDDCADAGWDSWKCWSWEDILAKVNVAILFKEAGELQLKMTFPTEGGDLGPFSFTKVKDYTGEGYSTGVEEVAPKASFSIYPNPTTGSFNVILNDAKEAEVTVTNLAGQVVYAATINGSAEINENLAAGIYVVSVKTANATSVQKLIVK